MTLNDAELLKEYMIEKISANDEELESFLFSLGCYAGEKITVVAKRNGTLVVALKDARYSIDTALAQEISIYPIG